MGFKEDIQKLVIDINERMPHISNEEQTKQSLIIPFINTLGYNASNPLEVKAEFTSDYGKKAGTRVDYAILKEGKAIIFIEAKPVNTILTNFDSQLEYYFNNSTNDVKLGIITNGCEYRFFTDLKKPNKMDEKPFLILSFLTFKDSDIDFLSCLKKDFYDNEKLSEFAETLAYTTVFNEFLKNLFNSPTDDFIRFLIKNTTPDVIVTAKIIERYRSIVKKSINTTILDMVSTGLLRTGAEIAEIQSKATQSPEEETKPRMENNSEKSQVETTDEELTALNLVKTILEKKGKDIKEIKGIDTVNYYSINNRMTTKWFIRFVLQSAKKSLSVRITPEKATTLLKGFAVEEAPAHLGGGSRIYFDSIKDLLKMQELIVYCFDEVNKTE